MLHSFCKLFILGVNVNISSNSWIFSSCRWGASIAYINFILYRADKGDTIKVSGLYHFDEKQKASAVAELTRKLSTNENTLTVGGLYAVDPLTTVKARLNDSGKLGALLQHEVKPKSLLTISGEFDTKSLDRPPKFGLALALKPWSDHPRLTVAEHWIFWWFCKAKGNKLVLRMFCYSFEVLALCGVWPLGCLGPFLDHFCWWMNWASSRWLIYALCFITPCYLPTVSRQQCSLFCRIMCGFYTVITHHLICFCPICCRQCFFFVCYDPILFFEMICLKGWKPEFHFLDSNSLKRWTHSAMLDECEVIQCLDLVVSIICFVRCFILIWVKHVLNTHKSSATKHLCNTVSLSYG